MRPMWLDAIIHMEHTAWPALIVYMACGGVIWAIWPEHSTLGAFAMVIGIGLWLFAWWLQYRLIRHFRPIAEQYQRLP